MLSPLIDCDARPKIRDLYPPQIVTDRWQVLPEDQLKDAVRGQLKFDPKKLGLHRPEGDVTPSNIKQMLKGQPVLDANVLYFLLENPGLIPEEYKDTPVFFYGTVFRPEDGVEEEDRIILYLSMRKGKEKKMCIAQTLDGLFNIRSVYPAAIWLP